MYFLTYLFPIFRYIALGSKIPQQMLAVAVGLIWNPMNYITSTISCQQCEI